MSETTWAKFDGYPIELYDGRFAGTFEMDEDSGEGIRYEQVVSFLVTGLAAKAAISTNKDGDVKRTNTFSIQEVVVLTPEEAASVLNRQTSLPEPEVYEPEPEPEPVGVDLETGEVLDTEDDFDEEVFAPGSSRPYGSSNTSKDEVLKKFLSDGV